MKVTDSSRSIVLPSKTCVNYALDDVIRKNIVEKGFSEVAAVSASKSSDLNTGVYEGGLKIWEGANDLCNFIDQNISQEQLKGKSVLELGCGAALPSICALIKGAKFAVINDFNDFVIECFSRENFRLNGIEENKWRAISGSWTDLVGQAGHDHLQPKSFDLILTSETIYNQQNYEALHEALNTFLADNGKILLAAKVYYFGLNSSIDDFQQFVTKKGVFDCVDVWTSAEVGVPRKIIQLVRR